MSDPARMAPSGAAARRRPWLVAAAALLLTFVAGAATGWTAARTRPAWARGPEDGAAHPHGERGRAAFERRLGVTPAQKTVIDSIFGVRRAQIDAFWRGPGRELRGILDSMQSDVHRVLTPAQRVRLDSMRAEGDKRGRHGRGRYGPFSGGPPGGGPGDSAPLPPGPPPPPPR